MPVDYQGLSTSDVKELLKKFGQNKLPEKPPPSDLKIFLEQLKSPLVYVLFAAGIVTLVLGHLSDTWIIMFAVVVNTILGFVQERKANKALEALKKLVHPTSEVIRDGKTVKIDASEIVPGDIVILNTGSKIPADGVLIHASRFFVNEAVLTGESSSIEKDTKDTVFMGTVVASGRGMMKVEHTGSDTQIGKIAKQVQEPSDDTPLKRQLEKLSKQLSLLVFILTLAVFVIGVIRGKNLSEIFATSVALAVSAIPEGLLVGLTVVLAIGMQRILAKKGLMRNLVSTETLGSVTVICTDKTGTLTKGKVKVTEYIGNEEDLVMQSIIANDMDDPIVIAAYEWANSSKAKNESIEVYAKKHSRLDSIPFSSSDRFFASLNNGKKTNTLFVNGAPEFILDWSNLTKTQKTELKQKIDELSGKGRRLVGYARKSVPSKKDKISKNDVVKDLEFVGILSFSDPVREGVKQAFEKTTKAGIETIVITGDYSQTAVHVMKELGIEVSNSEIMVGSELSKLTDRELRKRLKNDGHLGIKLFARTTPDQKLKIVKALKENGEIVAMMGDGVNDAPALKKADIGIVVEEATDVAKETADMVLLDSSFETIVAAVEEGRGIFDNIRKILLYLMSDAFGAIVAVVGTILFNLPLPVTASQILWINLISDGFPDLALTVDPKAGDLMQRPPRRADEPIMADWMKALIAIISFVTGVITLGMFIYYLRLTGDETFARSVAFLTLGLNSLVFVFSVRTLSKPFWKSNPFKNNWLNLAVFGGLLLQFVPYATNSTRTFFNIVFPGWQPLMYAFIGALFTFMMIEVLKSFIRKVSWFQS